MKKSFKVLLLAVMALCLAASASFADTVSYGITLDIQVGANMKTSHVKAYIGSEDGALSTDKASEAVYVVSVDDGTGYKDGHEIHISYDVTIVEPKFSINMTTADGELVSPIASISIGAVSSADSLVKIGTEGAKNANSEVTSWDAIPLPADGESYDLYIKTETASTSRYGTVVKLIVYAHASGDVEPPAEPFDRADIKVYMNGTLIDTVKASADVDSADVYVDLGAKVSFDVVLSSDVLSVSEDGVALASKDNYYTLSKDFAASGDKAVVVITFASGDVDTFKFTLNVIASGDSGGSGGDDGTGEVTVDSKAEEALEKLDTITAANISSEDIVAAFEALEIDGELTIDTSTNFTLFNLVKDDGTIAAIGIPALNAAIALLTSGNAGSETIDATTALNTVLGSDLLEAITAFCANGWNTFVTTVFNTSDMTEDNAKGIDESATSETGEDGAYKSFGVALDKKLPAGTILLFTLIDTDTDAQTYYAMVLPGAVNTEVSVIPFNVANLRAFDGSSTLGTSAPTIATSTYKIAYSTLDGGGADFSSASVLAAIKAAAVETGEAAYVGEYALTSTSDSSGSEEEPTDQVSSHGSSSGCDAGFGALALLAVAGALAARKVRK